MHVRLSIHVELALLPVNGDVPFIDVFVLFARFPTALLAVDKETGYATGCQPTPTLLP